MKSIYLKNSTHQSGAALVTALVFLVIMTMLALSSMTTNILEEKMAANTQEINRAFQAADTAAEMVAADTGALSTLYTKDENGTGNNSTDYTRNETLATGGLTIEASLDSVLLQETTPARSETSSAQNVVAYYHFLLSGTGTTASDLTNTSMGGAYTLGAPSGYSQ